MTRVLIVEDEDAFREPLAYSLTRDGFTVDSVADGHAALTAIDRSTYDLVLLDLMLPGIDGIEVARRLRANPATAHLPIIMVTAKGEVVDRVVGLEMGADDYLAKPYSYRELLARIRALLRRTRQPAAADDESRIVVADLVVDEDRHEVTCAGRRVDMPLREFELLAFLMRNPGIVLTRAQILDRVWGPDYEGETKTLDVHITRLRAKLEADPKNPRRIVTVRGLGYKLAED
ncbi:response regulator transcription factor [Nanchangia anserum]|uniref:Sensory transduction protein RegX3 n=1 Tax=Nanchangia anserum TaxID=2692125 RepID=A0A8I0GBK7_9ACTO|nr:response regulator transcription factor [Nanchangia anserum]MBD3689281.1 response regulator transcription factor [Nanchangia anserum]QOX81501.1 response regulator transcription factor [Nanchangia anserum]